VYVHTLRKKFSTGLIHTIRGVGYQIAPAHQIEELQ
jgi:DNA-binding response OmpR family regulator